QRYKLIHRTGAKSAFYDLQEDPNEFRNLIDNPACAPIRERLYAQLAQGVITRAEQFPAMWQPVVEIARPPGQSRQAGSGPRGRAAFGRKSGTASGVLPRAIDAAARIAGAAVSIA